MTNSSGTTTPGARSNPECKTLLLHLHNKAEFDNLQEVTELATEGVKNDMKFLTSNEEQFKTEVENNCNLELKGKQERLSKLQKDLK